MGGKDREKKTYVPLKIKRWYSSAVGGDRKNNEPDYEEVGPPTAFRKNIEKRNNDGQQHCDLCGSSEAAVRCDKCGSQAFCLSCDDMYHRHPRRSTHARKAVDSINTGGGGVRPPLPPKGETQGAPPPQPPPRKNKRSGFLGNSGFNKKDQNYQYSTGAGYSSYRSASLTNLQNGQNNDDGGARYSLALPIRKSTSAASEAGGSAGRTIMGSLKRFMGARPLPPTPDQGKGPVKNERPASATPKILTRANTSPSLPNLNDPLTNDDIRAGLPQSVLDINRTPLPNNSTSTPVTPASAHAQYPPLQPKSLQSNAHTQSLGRKFSLQQLPQSFDDKRTSLVEGTPGSVPWDGEAPKPAARIRSQSVSDDQWAQMMAAQPVTANTDGFTGPTCPPGHTPADMSAFAGATTRRSYNTMGARSGSSFGRGMVSSASVCDLNSLAQQQSQHGFSNSHAANSFQQLNMMGYNNGMMWGAPCDLCQNASMFTGHPNASGMKRTASNLSMNLSSVGSDVSGYPWGPPPPHMHHHMPPMYLGYYPGYHPHMGPPPMGSGMGLNMSIPDSMHTFGKVPSSPAPSVRSSSHRSHKSSKSRSFSAADTSGRSSRARKLKRSEESEESRSSSVSDDDEIDERDSKSGHPNSSIAWQCDHCTFINSGGVRTCGMCSKTMGISGRSSGRRGSERRRSERRRDRRTDHEDDDRELSDYDNDGGVVKSNLSFNIKDSKRENRSKMSGSSKSKSKKKSRRRGSSATESESGSDGGDDERLERHMRDLRLSSSSSRRRGSDYDGINNKDKDRERERSSRKKEGSSGRFKNRGKSHSERSRTPGRQTPRRSSPVDDDRSREGSPEPSPPEDGHNRDIVNGDSNGHQSSVEGTVVGTIASEATAKDERKSGSGSSDRENKAKEGIVSGPVNAVEGLNIINDKHNEPSLPVKADANKSRSCSPRLRIEKSKSPARSQRTSRGDADEPSFANTLDDITTIGTNEVADQDLSQYIDEQAQSTAEQLQSEQQDEIPVLNYIRPTTPVEEVAEEQRTIANKPPPVILENEKVGIQDTEKVVTKDTGQSQRKQGIPDSVYEPSYEPIEEPVQVEAPNAPETNQTVQIQVQDQNTREEADEGGTIDKIKAVEIKQGSPMVSRNMNEVIRSASSNSSLGPNSPQDRDRQYTPLSCSSSDAQFYSPPDSPDLSLSEQLRDVPANSQTQAFTLNQDSRPTNNSQTIRNREDEYLFTALETMQTAQTDDNLKSSRETIRSSMEQLPYSEEAFEGEKEKDIPPRPASAGAASAPPTDGYESLSFQDALTSSGASKLPRSSSAKDLLLSTSILDTTSRKMSSGIVSLQQEADRQARAAAWSTEELSEKYLTVEEIINKRRQKVMETQGLQLVQVLRDAEDSGYTAEEVSIALTHCGDKNPLEWLKENWKHMVDTVLTLATNYGHERRVNDIGAISAPEARLALRVHKGNIWAAVTECVEQRQKKFNDIDSRGKFKREDVVKALEKHSGDVDAAYLEVNQTQLKPFMMKIWSSISSPLPSHNKVTQSPAPTVSTPATVEVRDSVIPKVTPMPQETIASTQTVPTMKDVNADDGIEIHSLDEPGMAQTRTGPVTVQKASVIVGKAIAKAMARETSVRESQSRSVTPEVQETTLTTPEPSEGEEEAPGQTTVSDSDDEDHLRTLDTIPEEEEISDRTESRVSRSASRNLFLPFNPTDVIQLSPVAKAINKLIGTKTETKKPVSAKKTPTTEDSTPGTPHSYYNAAQQHTYYNQSGEKNYYNESGAKIEGESEPPKSVALDDYESMAEVKEELNIILRNDDVKTDSTNGETPSPDLDNDDDDDETIYYEEVVLKPGEEETSEGGKSQPSGSTRRRRRRRRRSRGHGGAASRADVVESPSIESAPASVPPTPSPPPAVETPANTSSNQETSTPAEGTTETAAVVKTVGKTSGLVDQRTYDIIQMAKSPAPMKASVPESSGESEEEEHGSSKTVSPYDRLKVPNLLVQIEGLKARHGKDTDYQEVRELKEQIQMMRKQLEARMEEDGEGRPDTPETPLDEELPPMGPVIHLQKSPSTERPPSREYEQLKFDRTVRRLLAEGQAGSYEKAELAAQLLSFNFQEGDALQAAEECSSIYTAIQFLQQECELCAEKYPMGKMVSMLQCVHRCCKECAKTYFTFQIKTKNIRDLRCPFCNEPDLDACEEIANEYLNNMDILLKSIIDPETHELFQRKLRDWTLMKDPNFRWCNKCSSGFIANSRARKLICPDCKDVTCAQCRATWENAHDGISCEAFAQWKTDNDLEVQAQGVAKHLAENGITCPKCKFTYSLAKGGCMHFTCTQCKYEFCSGCGQPFRQGSKCPVGPYCERLGLHAHHPRNCLFYLRDKEPHQLQNLLKDAGISYDTESRQVREVGQRVLCLVQEQKELPDGLKDDICGRIVPEGYAGLCKLHYTEYLVEKINTHKLDPVNIFDEADLRVCLRRNGKPVPVRRWESEKLYRDKLIKLIKEHLPLDSVEQ